MTAAPPHDPETLRRLPSVPGMGSIVSLVWRYDIQEIHRLPRVQECASSGRVVKGAHEAAGKRDGTSGHQSGQVPLTWAVSAAAVWCLVDNPRGQQY